MILNKKLLGVLALLGVFFLVTGFCDNDWMVNQYHNFDYAEVDIWWLSNVWSMDWWNAYVFAIVRVIVGSWLLGFCCIVYIWE